MDRNTAINKLADLIEANPDCTFEIDNDAWYMSAKGEEITNSEHWEYVSKWYGHSTSYGTAISEALIELLNRKGFGIEARAV
jgi:hypothetical protein